MTVADDVGGAPDAGPPTALLLGGALVVVAATALLVLEALFAHVLGYLLGTVVCIVLVTRYLQLDTRLAADSTVAYRPWDRSRAVCTLLLVVGLAVGTVHVWYLAFEAAVA